MSRECKQNETVQKGRKQCHRVIKKTHGMRQSREKHNKSLRFHRDQHCGHTEDLLKSLLGSIIPSAQRRHKIGGRKRLSLTPAGGVWSRPIANDGSSQSPRRCNYKVTDAAGEAKRKQARL